MGFLTDRGGVRLALAPVVVLYVLATLCALAASKTGLKRESI